MTRLEKLKELEENLYEALGKANSRSIAALARQYRETIREIDLIEGGDLEEDEVSLVIRRRQSTANE